MMFYALPWGTTAVVAALVLARRLRPTVRLCAMVLAAAAAFGYWDAVRNDGIWGDFHAALRWRWEPSPEDRFLAVLASKSAVPPDANSISARDGDSAPEPLDVADWPGFRGASRDGVVPGPVLENDWDAHRPRELWRIKVGPGWGSFSLAGRRRRAHSGQPEQPLPPFSSAGRQPPHAKQQRP
jgi:outer membrane protein assembly factor BamB